MWSALGGCWPTAPRRSKRCKNLRTAYAVAREQARIARFNQQFSEIRAPVAGRVVRKLLNEGELAAPGTPAFFMNATAAPGTWTLKAAVADKDWACLQVGDPAEIRLDAYPDRVFGGRVSRRAAGADPASGTWQIDVRVEARPGAPLATGLFARATLHPRRQATYQVVPADALVEGEGDDAFVFAPVGGGAGKVRKLPVKVAFSRWRPAVRAHRPRFGAAGGGRRRGLPDRVFYDSGALIDNQTTTRTSC